MKLFDRITLLKAGYTRKEIDQMIEDEKQEAAAAPEQAEPEDAAQTEPEQKEDPEPEKKDPEPETDYKALYEAERKAKEALQKQNRDRDRTDLSKKSDADTVKDVVASFF